MKPEQRLDTQSRFGSWARKFIKRLAPGALAKLAQEVAETHDLARLLRKRIHSRLTPEEETRMRQQLIDLCKCIPALAIFAAPGGCLLLPILIKVLPFNLLPTAFADEGE